MSPSSEVFRIYEAAECGRDGYPLAWHRLPIDHPALDAADLVLPGGVKDVVRALAAHRCERCRHPFRVGSGVGRWSPCDIDCQHTGPYRWRDALDDLSEWTVEASPEAEIGRLIHHHGRTVAYEAEYRVLTVHHLNGAKHDLRWWNLVSLCQRCHLQIQGRVQMERVWPWEHSDWFKPHAAGWYAFAYLDEDITREEAIARMDELLALERAA